ncbi:hypothetical protein KQI41_18715 [Tissierella pigra]|uniref:hypothetical protein n=1 Tax=Tissierella pigra TaxID=2607614 RepID=UPI001C11415F|nr:hypothetical protein [Tissierella pigra]MBU5428426.1 hypothetical protein [Tissierella pigra]
MIPSISGGLRVGLDVEPTVSTSFEGKTKNILEYPFGVMPRGYFIIWGKCNCH